MLHLGKTVSSMCRRSFYGLDSLVVERPLRVREVAGSNPGRIIKKLKNGTSASLAWRSAVKGKNWLFFSHTLVVIDTIRNETSRVINISCRTCFTIDLN